jgi:molecular chaperone DnaK
VHVPMLGVDRKGRRFDLEYRLTRDELDTLTAPLVERTIGITEEMMKSAGYRAVDIQNVILVGGSTRMPLIRRRIQEVFGRAPLGHLDPDVCVAHGAAIVARNRSDLGAEVLLDVLSVPIGVVFPGGGTRFVFEANRSLPAHTRIPLDPPATVGAAGMVVGLWQGPDIASSERHVLGVLRIPPHLLEGAANCGIDLTLNEDLSLRARFTSSTQQVPLFLEGQRQA